MAYEPVMELDVNNTGYQSIRYTFEDIRYLEEDEAIYSPRFYLCNTAWQLYIERTSENTEDYLSIFLEKVDDDYEIQFSYHVEMDITLLSYDQEKNIVRSLEGNSPNARFMFGMRDGELMARGIPRIIHWGALLNPKYGFLTEDEDEIEVELSMKLVKIWPHRGGCVCGYC